MPWAVVLGFATGAACVCLAVMENVWNWPSASPTAPSGRCCSSGTPPTSTPGSNCSRSPRAGGAGGFGVSGTAVHTAPARHWHHVARVVRAGLTRRICVVGAESTGTTTLARALADHYGTVWVPEYGRDFAEAKLAADGSYRWSTDEFTEIATGQQSREDLAVRAARPLPFCDTDALATAFVDGVVGPEWASAPSQ
jgi:AAA domain-containing protein